MDETAQGERDSGLALPEAKAPAGGKGQPNMHKHQAVTKGVYLPRLISRTRNERKDPGRLPRFAAPLHRYFFRSRCGDQVRPNIDTSTESELARGRRAPIESVPLGVSRSTVHFHLRQTLYPIPAPPF